MIIPRTMSTQHPDNVQTPFFSSSSIIGLAEEIKEVQFILSLGCHEQMWDFEGKITLPGVVSEIIARNQTLAQEKPLGKNFFLTFRVPNPEVEKNEAKLIAEILESIPRSYDVARKFYQQDIPPVFEVILPMATSVEQLNRVYYYYQNFVAGKGKHALFPNCITIDEWLGDFNPKNVNVIPLFEDMDSQLNAAQIVERYLRDKDVDYQRVFLARSDPALNYGSLAAVLLINIALVRLHKLEQETGIPIYPILGVGSAPFRGNLKPTNVESMLQGYSSCQTFTLQSAFKYDWPISEVVQAIKIINSTSRTDPQFVDEKESLQIIHKTVSSYREQISEIANLSSQITPHLPKRRLRKMHIGLFGYSRNSGGVQLPRAIPFCASLYSIGLPPEILGLQDLNDNDISVIKRNYSSPSFEEDLRDSLTFYNSEVLSLLSPRLQNQVRKTVKLIDYQTDCEHAKITSQIIRGIKEKKTDNLQDLVLEASQIRRFLG